MTYLAPLLAAMGPLLLWPVELLLPFPFIVEEIFKGGVVCLILSSPNRRTQEKLLILSALLFSFSETILYVFNFSLVGTTGAFLTRLIATTLMHTSTFLIIYFFGRKNLKLIPAGILAGSLIHFSYNSLIQIL